MWLKGFLLVIFLCSYIGYGETSPKKCYCGYIEFEISDNDGQSKAKPPVHCTQEMDMYDSKPLHGKCYRTYEHKSCKDPSMNCENGVSSILTVHFNKFDGYDRSLDTATDKTGSVAISDDVFSITVKCSHSINCSINVPYWDLMFQSGSYQQFLDKIAFVSKQIKLAGRSEEKFNNQTSIQDIRHGKTLQSTNEDQNDPTQEWNPDFTTILYKPKSKKKSAFRMELKSGSQECYCGSLRIPILKKNASLSKAGNPWQCRNGQGNYDSSPQQGRCYVTFKYYKCVEHECTEEVGFYLNVYYNKLDEVPDALKNNQTVRGHFNYNTDTSFDLTLYCEGEKCDVNLDTPAANVSKNGGMQNEYSDSVDIIKTVANELQNKPEALPPPTTPPPVTVKEIAEATWCHCGHLRLESDLKFKNITKRLSENCTQDTSSGYNPAALNKRCYVTFESERCEISKDCQPGMNNVYDVYFNKFVGYNRSLDSNSDIVGIVNSYKDQYTFSVTLTCGQDFCTPNASYASTPLLDSNLGKTAISVLHSKLMALVNQVDSEQKPMAMVKSDIVGIVNSYKDQYTFSVTLTCGEDFCTPNASYASTPLLESNLGKTAISDLHSKLVALVNIVDSEQKPMAMVKSTTPLYDGYDYFNEGVETTTKSDTGLSTGGLIGIGFGCLMLVAIANFVFVLVTKRILSKKKTAATPNAADPSNAEVTMYPKEDAESATKERNSLSVGNAQSDL